MKVSINPVTPFQQNSSLLVCEKTGKGAIVDPGGEVDRLIAHSEEHCDGVEKILLTHGHIDHAAAAAELSEDLGLPIEGPHIADKFLLDDLEAHGARMGIPGRPVTPGRCSCARVPTSWRAAARRVRAVSLCGKASTTGAPASHASLTAGSMGSRVASASPTPA